MISAWWASFTHHPSADSPIFSPPPPPPGTMLSESMTCMERSAAGGMRGHRVVVVIRQSANGCAGIFAVTAWPANQRSDDDTVRHSSSAAPRAPLLFLFKYRTTLLSTQLLDGKVDEGVLSRALQILQPLITSAHPSLFLCKSGKN